MKQILVLFFLSATLILKAQDTTFVNGQKGFGKKVDGLKQEYWQFFHSNGRIQSDGYYVNDTLDGSWKSYDEVGTLLSEGKYDMGKPSGCWTVYLPNGDPLPAQHYTMLGSRYNELGEYIASIGFLNTAVNFDKKNKQARYLRAEAYYKIGEIDLAIEDVLVIVEQDSTTESLKYLTQLKIEGSRLESALETANTILAIDPKDKEAIFIRGKINYRLKEKENACKDFILAHKRGYKSDELAELLYECSH
ncbi:MAG: hypothetical protein ACFB15_19520 [Cyclobacteriaceae bacterium]